MHRSYLNAELFPASVARAKSEVPFSSESIADSITLLTYTELILLNADAAKIQCFKPENDTGHGISIKVPGAESMQTVFNQEDNELYPVSTGTGGRLAQIGDQDKFNDVQYLAVDSLIQVELAQESKSQPPDSFSEDMTASDDDSSALKAEDALNDKCRGGSGDEQATQTACDARDKAYDQLKKRGWCWGPTLATGANQHWLRCDKGGNPLPP